MSLMDGLMCQCYTKNVSIIYKIVLFSLFLIILGCNDDEKKDNNKKESTSVTPAPVGIKPSVTSTNTPSQDIDIKITQAIYDSSDQEQKFREAMLNTFNDASYQVKSIECSSYRIVLLKKHYDKHTLNESENYYYTQLLSSHINKQSFAKMYSENNYSSLKFRLPIAIRFAKNYPLNNSNISSFDWSDNISTLFSNCSSSYRSLIPTSNKTIDTEVSLYATQIAESILRLKNINSFYISVEGALSKVTSYRNKLIKYRKDLEFNKGNKYVLANWNDGHYILNQVAEILSQVKKVQEIHPKELLKLKQSIIEDIDKYVGK